MKPRRINADKPHLWKTDIAASVDQFNQWFMRFAPKAFRSTRVKTTGHVKAALIATRDLRSIDAATLKGNPSALSTLRMCQMCTAPPLAVDRDIFPWLEAAKDPTDHERDRASTIVADRLCSAVANPIVRNAQEQRQLKLVGDWLNARGYRKQGHPSGKPLAEMEAGTYTFRMNLPVGKALKVNLPVDVVIQPKKLRKDRLPVLIEAKSAGDFTNTNKRRKEEATKIHQLQAAYGKPCRSCCSSAATLAATTWVTKPPRA